MNPNENNGKVSFKKINYKLYQGANNIRYKTALCRHFDTPQGCSYGEKCQFAHGINELKQIDKNMMAQNPMQAMDNKQKNILNYKIVKCKNWEKDKSCKYGAHCTFAHGDADLRNKADNLYQMNNSFPMMVPMAVPPGMDMNQMQQIMLSNQLMMSMNPQFANQNQNAMQGKPDTQGEK